MDRLQVTANELSLLLRRTDEHLRESGLYRFTTDLVQQITAENAGQFLPAQLVRLRRLTARTARWQEPPGGIWMRILTRLGILDRLRLGQLEQGLRAVALLDCRIISCQGLHQRLDALLSLEAVYPLLMATARQLQAQPALTATRPDEAIRADLDKAYAAKVAHDRRQLSRHWIELVNAAKPRAAQLQTLLPLFDRPAPALL